jgi:hypothetical protein
VWSRILQLAIRQNGPVPDADKWVAMAPLASPNSNLPVLIFRRAIPAGASKKAERFRLAFRQNKWAGVEFLHEKARETSSSALTRATVKSKSSRKQPSPPGLPATAVGNDPEAKAFDQEMELFNAGRFEAAKQILEPLLETRNLQLAHVVKLRILMCEQRLTRALWSS